MKDFPVPEAALDAAEQEWYARISRGQYDPPRDHIRALFEVAMPYLIPIQGEVVQEDDQSEAKPAPSPSPADYGIDI